MKKITASSYCPFEAVKAMNQRTHQEDMMAELPEESSTREWKECPFCAEKISIRAKKCRYCGETIDVTLRLAEELKDKYQQELEKAKPGSTAAGNPVSGTMNGAVSASSCPMGQLNVFHVRKKRTTYILLGIFLGIWGAHNFYAGYNGRGTAQLLLTIFTGWLLLPLISIMIWNIVEICVVNRDGDHELME